VGALYPAALALGAALLTPRVRTLPLAQGPCFVKYNAVLRGVGGHAPTLLERWVELCGSEAAVQRWREGDRSYDELVAVRQRVNTYSTTLHVINSSIVKLSKLTKAVPVYRGISGRVLPREFWAANEFGAKGGVRPLVSIHRPRKVVPFPAASLPCLALPC